MSDLDLRALTREMAEAIMELPVLSQQGGQVTIAFLKVVNRLTLILRLYQDQM